MDDIDRAMQTVEAERDMNIKLITGRHHRVSGGQDLAEIRRPLVKAFGPRGTVCACNVKAAWLRGLGANGIAELMSAFTLGYSLGRSIEGWTEELPARDIINNLLPELLSESETRAGWQEQLITKFGPTGTTCPTGITQEWLDAQRLSARETDALLCELKEAAKQSVDTTAWATTHTASQMKRWRPTKVPRKTTGLRAI